MKNLDQRVRATFDAITLPAKLKYQTLRMLTRKRNELKLTKRSRQPRVKQTVFALAACLMVCALGLGGYRLYATETALVEIELNPSLELSINRFDRVIDARANNSDGQRVLSSVAVINSSYEQALASLVESPIFLSYIDASSLVEVSVITASQEQSATLADYSQNCIARLPCAGSCQQVSAQAHQQALEAGMGVARFRVAQQLMALDPKISLEDCRSMSMKELRQRISAVSSQ
ncbi:MAG: hypothetical protein LBP91_05055 [Coriobacteriales bacterium]|jgi:hypothetical protein|nr:hypothetical protein [Coriobacteriales bacterium]